MPVITIKDKYGRIQRTYNSDKMWGLEVSGDRFIIHDKNGDFLMWDLWKKYKSYQSVLDAYRDYTSPDYEYRDWIQYVRIVKIKYDEFGYPITEVLT